MATDIFGYNKDNVSTTALLPPGAILVSIDGSKIALAQSVNVMYRRETQPVYELGSENVYLVSGKSSGTVEVQRMIGDAFDSYVSGDPCGMQDINITKGSATCGDGDVSLSMKGMCTQIGFRADAGGLTVTDSASFTIVTLSKG